jgi:hypothetical protein
LNGKKLRLAVAAALFVGWLSWLGYTALAKNRGPVVSHVQVEAAAHAVVAEVKAGEDGGPAPLVKVIESLKPNSPAAGSELYLSNITDAKGFDGPGEYFLLLRENTNPRPMPLQGREVPMREIVGMQRSPGYEPSGAPTIYRMSDSIRAQFQKLSR